MSTYPNMEQYVESMEIVKSTLSWAKLITCQDVIDKAKLTDEYISQTTS